MAVEIVDSPIYEKHRKILTDEQTWIPSLTLIGNANQNKANMPLKDHYHNNNMEFVVVLDGMQKYTVDGVEYTLYGNDVFVTQPNEIHSTGDNPQMVSDILWFQIDMAKTDDFLGILPHWQYHIYNMLLNLKARTWQINAGLIKQLVQSFNLLCSGSINQKCKGSSLFIYSLLQLIELSEKTINATNDKIKVAKDYIDKNFYEIITIEELAVLCGFSLSALKHKFKEVIGMAPREYINFVKINEAKRLLKQDELSVTDIAFKLGYNSSNYFCVSFKQFAGMSPSKYRQIKKIKN